MQLIIKSINTVFKEVFKKSVQRQYRYEREPGYEITA